MLVWIKTFGTSVKFVLSMLLTSSQFCLYSILLTNGSEQDFSPSAFYVQILHQILSEERCKPSWV